ncbi:MAG TPA: large-conductance mechanosensitive channel protein MscL [Blastocatellia bacterium]|nr:large-conductance mechanosensitive channel protein MscL [Blastocatellia bacterium]
MGMAKDFGDFIKRGNVIDLAIGVVIGAAFGKVVASVVDGIIMPPIGKVLGGVNFSDLKYVLDPAITDAAGKVTKPEAAILYGAFIQTVIEFLIIAFVVFLIVKAYNRMRATEPPPPPTPTESLLADIRDLLKRG